MQEYFSRKILAVCNILKKEGFDAALNAAERVQETADEYCHDGDLTCLQSCAIQATLDAVLKREIEADAAEANIAYYF